MSGGRRPARARWSAAGLACLVVAACGGPPAPTGTPPPAPVAMAMVANCHVDMQLSGAMVARSTYWGWGQFGTGVHASVIFGVVGADGPGAVVFVADSRLPRQATVIAYDGMTPAEVIDRPDRDQFPIRGRWSLAVDQPAVAAGRIEYADPGPTTDVASMTENNLNVDVALPPWDAGSSDLRLVGTADCGETQFDFSPRPSGSG